MLKKLLTSLRRSPALSEELARYDLKIKKEYKLRKIGLVLTVAIIPLFAYLLYIDSTLITINYSDLLPGGISSTGSKTEIISDFDANKNNFRSAASALTLSRDDLIAMQHGSWDTNSSTYVWNYKPILSSFDGEQQINIDTGLTIYGRPSNLISNQTISGWRGNSETIGWFGIDDNNGNIYTNKNALELVAPTDKDIEYSLRATNISNQNPNSIAKPGNLIEYSLQAINKSAQPKIVSFSINIGDILEYASPTLDLGGASINKNETLSWPDVYASAGSTETRTFMVKIKDPISIESQSKQNKLSYNCSLEAVYGNLTKTPVECTKYKQLELQFNELPNINLWLAVWLLIIYIILVVALFYRTRSIKKVIATIKKELHQGPLS